MQSLKALLALYNIFIFHCLLKFSPQVWVILSEWCWSLWWTSFTSEPAASPLLVNIAAWRANNRRVSILSVCRKYSQWCHHALSSPSCRYYQQVGWEIKQRKYLKIIISRFGTRVTCVTGALVSSVAIFCSSYSSSLSVLLISYGVFGGEARSDIAYPTILRERFI